MVGVMRSLCGQWGVGEAMEAVARPVLMGGARGGGCVGRLGKECWAGPRFGLAHGPMRVREERGIAGLGGSFGP